MQEWKGEKVHRGQVILLEFAKLLVKKESNPSVYKNLTEEERLTETTMLSFYLKIIKQYELQIEDLKTIIRNLNNDKN